MGSEFAPGSKVVNTSFEIDADLWSRFGLVSRANDRSRGAELRRFVRESVESFEEAA